MYRKTNRRDSKETAEKQYLKDTLHFRDRYQKAYCDGHTNIQTVVLFETNILYFTGFSVRICISMTDIMVYMYSFNFMKKTFYILQHFTMNYMIL